MGHVQGVKRPSGWPEGRRARGLGKGELTGRSCKTLMGHGPEFKNVDFAEQLSSMPTSAS